MTSRTTDIHCTRCRGYMFSVYPLDEIPQGSVCDKCLSPEEHAAKKPPEPKAQPATRARNVLSCGCKSAWLGFPAEWDTESRRGEPAVASGNICERHYFEWGARPASSPQA